MFPPKIKRACQQLLAADHQTPGLVGGIPRIEFLTEHLKVCRGDFYQRVVFRFIERFRESGNTFRFGEKNRLLSHREGS